MAEVTSNRRHVEDSSSRPPNRNVSVMRRYLESGIDFEWPEGVGKRDGNHCTLNSGPGHHIPLIWKSRISDKKASIDIYTGDEKYAFKEAFAVKTIREKTHIKSKTRARNEIESMRDLRYPHVAALLGTFTYLDRLSILIFPAAPCDLYMFLKVMSKEMRDIRRGRTHELAYHHTRTDTPESRSSTSSLRDAPPGSPRCSSHSYGSPQSSTEYDNWPMSLTLPAKVDSLRRYFVCLSQALNYIHESDVRHKDIKPENILLDSSGNVVLTDFGISRRFPKKAPHVTNDQWLWTRKYASPEIMKGKKVPRDDPSDVFSLGCVFLEMATLILGRDLDWMREYYATSVNESGIEDAYYCNLEKVYGWISSLQHSRDVEPRSAPDLSDERIDGQDFLPDSDAKMIESLVAIRQMLDSEPPKRPAAKELWSFFKDVSFQKCRDCDPRLPNDIWRPNTRQKDAVESGTSRRRSMQLIPEEASDNPSTESRDGQPENENLLSANFRPDRNGIRGRRGSSPHATHTNTYLDPSSVYTPSQTTTRPEAPSSTGMTSPAEKTSYVRRTSSATDARGAVAMQSLKISRSASPTKRRQLLESRVHFGTPEMADTSGSGETMLPPKGENTSNKPSVPGSEPAPVWQHATGPSHSLTARSQSARTDASDVQEKITDHQGQNDVPPETQIIIYDLAKKRSYISAFGHLEGTSPQTTRKKYGDDYISQPLPRSGKFVEIRDKGSPIAIVDLGSLGAWIRFRRWKGDFPMLYVLNFSVQPLG
ncbi:MAG: hypothetical protein Q9194_003444 [Teloschistes cf. exilis]